MTEIELKLQLPAAARAAVERAIVAAPASSVRLQAIYFDTPDRRLAAAGLALRLRKEGRRWVQTLKAGSAHGLERAEHNVAVTVPAGLQPAIDPARHAGTPPGQALAALLASAGPEADRLQALYRTDIRRRHRELRTRGGVVELALDMGEIVATGPDGMERRWPVAELEIERLRGAPRLVAEVGARWAARHGLWPDTRTKAERGDRLARGLGPADPVAAVKAAPVMLDEAMKAGRAWQAVLDTLLAHALPNWSELAAGSRAAETVHQLRVALRRLRSAQRFFAGWPGVPEPGAAILGAAVLFRALGAARDADVLSSGLGAQIDAVLAAQGEPPLPRPAAQAPAWDDAASATHGRVVIDLLGALLALPAGAAPGSDRAAAEGSLRELAAARLQDWHRQVQRDAKRFARLDDEARHRLRKRLKRLRYAVEFSAGLFGRRGVARYLERVRDAQERLGEFNDVTVAEAVYRPLAAQDPRAWFALGWLAARRESTLAASAAGLARLRKVAPFWR